MEQIEYKQPQLEGVTMLKNFIGNPENLLNFLIENVKWDCSMSARKTASFGIAYNYRQMSYPKQDMPKELQDICSKI